LTQTRQDAASGDTADVLAAAVERFEQALQFEPDNAFAQLMLASASLNLAKHRDHEANTKKAYAALTAAYENREKSPSAAVREEIMGDYALLVQKDFRKAAEHYTRLATDESFRGTRFALRAHWMLAGIFMGDWGVNDYEKDLPKEKLKEMGVVNLDLAREHIVAILAHWDGTPQSDFFRRHMDSLKSGQEAVRRPPSPSQRSKQYVDLPVGQLQLVAY
jgi:tetratricopeptide (TPR) repeat protein